MSVTPPDLTGGKDNAAVALIAITELISKIHLAQQELDELSVMLCDKPSSEMEIDEFETFIRDFWTATGFSKFF